MATGRKGTRKKKTNQIAENQPTPEYMPIRIVLNNL